MKESFLPPEVQELNSLMMDLQSAIKFSRLYPLEHPLLKKSVQKALGSLTGFLGGHERLRLRIKLADIYANGHWINKDHEVLQGLARNLYTMGIGELCFYAGTEETQILKFLTAISLSPDAAAERGGIEAVWADQGFAAIRINETLRNEVQKILSALASQGEGALLSSQNDALSLMEFLGGGTGELSPGGYEFLSGLLTRTDQMADLLGVSARQEYELHGAAAETAPGAAELAQSMLQPLSRILGVLEQSSPELRKTRQQQLATTVRHCGEEVKTGVLAGMMPKAGSSAMVGSFLTEFSFSELGMAAQRQLEAGTPEGEISRMILDLPLDEETKKELLDCLELGEPAETGSSTADMPLAGWGPILTREDFLALQIAPIPDPEKVTEITRLTEEELARVEKMLQATREESAVGSFWQAAEHMLNLFQNRDDLESLCASLQSRMVEHIQRQQYEQSVMGHRKIREFSQSAHLPPEIRTRLEQISQEVFSPQIRQKMIREAKGADKNDPRIHHLMEYLGLMKGELTADLLDWLEVEEQRWLRRAICQLVTETGTAALPELWKRLQADRWYVARNMLSILGMINDPSSLEVIKPLLRHPHPQVRKEALKSLGLSGNPAVFEKIASALNDQEEQVKISAIEWLGLLQDPRAAPLLLLIVEKRSFFFEEVDLKKAAIQALANLGDPGLIDRLKPLAKKPWLAFSRRHHEIAAEAQKALDQLRKKRLLDERAKNILPGTAE